MDMGIVRNGDTWRNRNVIRRENEVVGMGDSVGPQYPLVHL